MKYPLIAPCPPRLSTRIDDLIAVERSGIFSNSGPVVRRFEADATARLFGGIGACVTVANATLGLMLAIRQAADAVGRGGGLALMPAFTFAATAHAAEWAGLTPLLADVDPDSWALSPDAVERAFARHGDRIAVVVPYATFGEDIDLDFYADLAARHGVGVVVDAAASLGALDARGRGFGTGAPFAVVYSMHATKTFATAEGGLVHSGDAALIEQLRAMANFGFGAPRSATLPGFNAKLPEVLGVLAAARLEDFADVPERRAALIRAYREQVRGVTFQAPRALRPAVQFASLLLPRELAPHRPAILAGLAERGIGAATYFAPHLGQQPHFQATAIAEPTPVSDDIAARILSLPATEAMTPEDVGLIALGLNELLNHARPATPKPHPQPLRVRTLLVGGGPAGIALLDAATKTDRLRDFADGLLLVERGHSLGGGELPSYAITSDSTAETFLSAVKDNVHPELAALTAHPGGQEIARWIGKLGVPLARTGVFLEAMGDRLGRIVADHGGRVLLGHEVRGAQRLASGEWQAELVDVATGSVRPCIAEHLVIATGGYQSETDILAEPIAGAPLGEVAGDRVLLGDAMLRLGGVERLRERLGANPAPRIAIVGASTSALAAAALLLKANPAFPLGQGAITLLHRQPLRPFYPSVAAAHADGFTDFGEDDICPVSGFVYRLAGFRLEARELVLRTLGVGGRVPDPRLTTHQIGEDDAATRAILDRADVVVAALGYRPRALPLFDTAGRRIALSAHAPGRPRMVDQQCRIIDAHGQPLPGAYGIGLAAGFVPEGRLGGEKSFRGKANGLWLWQNDIGLMIVDQILDRARGRAAA